MAGRSKREHSDQSGLDPLCGQKAKSSILNGQLLHAKTIAYYSALAGRSADGEMMEISIAIAPESISENVLEKLRTINSINALLHRDLVTKR